MRYIRNSSDERVRRAQARYSISACEIEDIRPHSCSRYSTIYYADRRFFLWPASTLHLHPLTRPPLSACLQRRMQRWTALQRPSDSAATMQSPPVFVIPYSPLSAALPTRELLMKAWDMIQVRSAKPFLVQSSLIRAPISLLNTLVYARARQLAIGSEPTPAVPIAATTDSAHLILCERGPAITPSSFSSLIVMNCQHSIRPP